MQQPLALCLHLPLLTFQSRPDYSEMWGKLRVCRRLPGLAAASPPSLSQMSGSAAPNGHLP